jgi:hypothetical protein
MAFGGSAVERLVIRVDVDTDKATGKLDKFGSRVSKAAVPAAAVGAALGAMAVKAGKSASRLQQSGGAIDSVFGKSAGTVKEWAAAADQSVGLSEAAYGELATTIGAQLKNMGTPLDQIAGKTDELIRTGADLAATYGGTTADAVGALGSALRGETDPVEKYGIAIKQATIEAAVGKGKLKGMTDEQAKQAKTTALLGLVHEQAGGAIGAFGREADTAAGQQQRAAAATEDMSAHLGTVFLPVMAQAAKALAAFAGWAQRNKTLVLVLGAVLGTLAAAVLVVVGALKVYNIVTQVMAVVSKAAWLSALGPIALVIAAIVAVVAVFVILYKKVDWFRAAVDKAWALIRKGAAKAFGFIKAYVSLVFKALTIYVRVWLAIARGVFLVIKTVARIAFAGISASARGAAAVFRAVFAAIRRISSAVWTAIRTAARAAFSAAGAAARTLRDVIAGVVTSIRDRWDRVFEALGRIVQRIMDAARIPVDRFLSGIGKVIDAVSRLIGWIGRISFPKPPGWLSKLPGVGSLTTTTATSGTAGGVSVFGAGLRPGTTTATGGGGGPTINIYGALDPAAVAVQIRRILRDDDRRRGRVIPGGGTGGAR